MKLINAALTTVWHVRLFFAAYILLIPIFTSVLLPQESSGAISPVIPTMLAGEIATLLICAVLALKGHALSRWRPAWKTATALLTVGSVPFVLEGFGIHIAAFISCACALALGIGKAIAFLLWAHIYARLGMQKAVLYGCAMCLCAGVCAFLALGLRDEWVALVALVAPTVTMFAWRMSANLPGIAAPPTPPAKQKRRISYPWRPIAIMTMAGFSAGAGTATAAAQTMTQQTVPLIAIGAVTLAYVLLSKGLRFDYVLKGSITGYVLGFASQAVLPESDIPGYLIFASYWGLYLFAFCILCKASSDEAMPSEWLFGIGFSISEGIQLLGYFASRLTPISATEDEKLMMVIAAALVLAIGMIVLWLSEHSKVGRWASTDISKTVLEEPDSTEQKVAAILHLNATACGLTSREEEIARLLAASKTVAEIAQDLFVSQNTIKTHCKHIYAKCGVHSRQELRDRLRREP